ncbi:hypothetical protein AFR_03740 [Actinoplanes friuliensis DSM 7358]|uniref:NmrA-like domain-containing protein n=1 Tax=Actinoplanes friuliensis DSM 7358 TaxID=1246995 RepID=U5VQG7_9ACTN|nr:hypothetical protein AFR_03740 [Actinoplanes friuliensis DSM 7358]
MERLTDQGRPVRVGSRSGKPPFDWNDESTWAPALEGVTAAYITYYPDLALPGAVAAVDGFARLAAHSGVEQLVLLSGRGEPEAEAAERAVQGAGTGWTVVRSSWFSQNFSESFLLDPVQLGDIALPAGDAREPFTDADDIADVVTAALVDSRHRGKVYEVTGPRLLSFAEVAAELSAATGRTITYTPVSRDEYSKVLEENGLPLEFADLFAGILDGRNAHLTDGVQQALGRAPKDFADYARESAAAGAWER